MQINWIYKNLRKNVLSFLCLFFFLSNIEAFPKESSQNILYSNYVNGFYFSNSLDKETRTFAATYKQLEIVKKNNQLIKQELAHRIFLHENFKKNQFIENITNEQYRESKFILLNIKKNIQEINLQYLKTHQIIETIKNRIQFLKEKKEAFLVLGYMSSYIAKKLLNIEKQITLELNILELLQEQKKILKESTRILEEHLNLEKQFYSLLQEHYALQKNIQAKFVFEKLIQVLQKKQEDWIGLASERQIKLQSVLLLDVPRLKLINIKQNLELEIFEAKEMSDFYEQEISIMRLKYDTKQLSNLIKPKENDNELKKFLQQLDSYENHVQALENVLKEKIDFLKGAFSDYSNFVSIKFYNKVRINLINKIENQIAQLKKLKDEIQIDKKFIDGKIEENIFYKHKLSEFTSYDWKHLLEDIIFIPTFTWYALEFFVSNLFEKLKSASFLFWIYIITFSFGYSFISYFFYNYLKKIYRKYIIGDDNFFKKIIAICSKYFLRYFWFYIISIFILIGLGIFLQNINVIKSAAIFVLTFSLFTFSLHLSKSFIKESIKQNKNYPVKIYFYLKILIVSACTLTLLKSWFYRIPDSSIFQNIVERLLMLIILLFSFFLIYVRRTCSLILMPYLKSRFLLRKFFILNLSLIFSIFLMLISGLGLIGYLGLAWKMMQYFGIFVFFMTMYFVLYQFSIDFMDWVSARCINRTKNGWFWSEAFLKPIAWLLKIFIFVALIFSLILSYGLDQNSIFMQFFKRFISFPLFTIGDSPLTVLNMLNLFFIILIFYWMACWMREVSYRWFYKHVEDLGLRDTLSIFSQYAIVFIGFFITLDFLKIDFKSLTLLASALAVGIGFGLRNLANDFVCGFLLLIERPVRKGDLVSIGSFEGKVIHIGMRAMTIQTWDHMEVIVPNSETFSKTFTNWTHEDSIVRTVFTVRVSREDDPKKIQDIILATLCSIDNILKTPAAEIFFKDISESLLEFQVGYYINMAEHHSRLEVRSKVLFILWERFAESKIHPPYPSQELFIRNCL